MIQCNIFLLFHRNYCLFTVEDICTNPWDNCPLVPDTSQTDLDRDGVGDLCDNCPNVNNTDQNDTDVDGVGDVCDTGNDQDADGIQDDRDNCPSVANSNQHDADADGIGDLCDRDADNDGILNENDNCWIVPNPNQKNKDNDSRGDACDNDNDGDNVPDIYDNSDNNSKIFVTDFSVNEHVAFDIKPKTNERKAVWIITDSGKEVREVYNSPASCMLGEHRLNGFDFEGTFFVGDPVDFVVDYDFVGIVFAFQVSMPI